MRSRNTANSAPVRAAIYCRISKADEGDHVKTDDQERICRELADRLGWKVVDVYTDHSKTAWQKNRKRPAWDRMLADVDAGRVNGIIVYHGDRLVRRPEDLADLMRLAESKGVKLASPSGTRNLDNERLELWVRAAFAEEESQRLSERRQAQYDRWRRQGKVRPGGRGGRAFGFETDGVTRVEAECGCIREMAARVLAGEAVNSIAKDVSARGFRSVTGRELTYSAVKRILANPRYAGLMPDGESAAAWEPVLGRQTWERVRLVLSAKAGEFGYATNARVHLLSGIAVCGGCGALLQIKSTGSDQAKGYACRSGCGRVFRSAPALDAYVSAAVVKRLANPFNPEGRAVPVDRAAEWSALQRERDETESLLSDFAASAGRARLLTARLEQIDVRMAELRAEAGGTVRRALLTRYRGIARGQWEELPLDVRRALVSACVRVTVLPASKRGREFRPEDVRLEPVS